MNRPRATAGAASLLALVSLPLATAMDPDGLVDQARKGLAAFIASYPDVPAVSPDDILLAECPLMTPDELVRAVAPVGDASALEDVITGSIQVDRLTEHRSFAGGVHPSVLGVVCDTEDYEDENEDENEDASLESGAGVYGLGIGVFDYSKFYGEYSDIPGEGIVEEFPDAIVIPPSAETFGGTLYGFCDREDAPEGAMTCYEFLDRDGFSVGMYVAVPEGDEGSTIEDLREVFLAELPGLLQRIADGLPHVDVASSPPTTISTEDSGHI